jgi:hypothetical protein
MKMILASIMLLCLIPQVAMSAQMIAGSQEKQHVSEDYSGD